MLDFFLLATGCYIAVAAMSFYCASKWYSSPSAAGTLLFTFVSYRESVLTGDVILRSFCSMLAIVVVLYWLTGLSSRTEEFYVSVSLSLDTVVIFFKGFTMDYWAVIARGLDSSWNVFG